MRKLAVTDAVTPNDALDETENRSVADVSGVSLGPSAEGEAVSLHDGKSEVVAIPEFEGETLCDVDGDVNKLAVGGSDGFVNVEDGDEDGQGEDETLGELEIVTLSEPTIDALDDTLTLLERLTLTDADVDADGTSDALLRGEGVVTNDDETEVDAELDGGAADGDS